MNYSRRKFMKAGLLAAACAGLPLKSALGQKGIGSSEAFPFLNAGLNTTSSSLPASIEQLSYYNESAFTPYVNTRFRVRLSSSNTRSLLLTDVNDYLTSLAQVDATANSTGTECFSLIFRIPPGKPFTQDTYLVEHEALGTFYMFLVSVGAHSKKSPDYYEAVIYRRPQSGSAQQQAIVTEPTTAASQPAQGPWRVTGAEGVREVFAFAALMPPPPDVSGQPK